MVAPHGKDWRNWEAATGWRWFVGGLAFLGAIALWLAPMLTMALVGATRNIAPTSTTCCTSRRPPGTPRPGTTTSRSGISRR
jgi:hypothetical protein